MESSLGKIKKPNMRPLTSSEKFLLIILAIVIVIFLSNNFILKPQAEKISALQTEKLDLDSKIIDMNNTLKKEEDLKKEQEVLLVGRNDILANYFPTLDQSQIIYLLNDLVSDEGIDISDYQFSNPVDEMIGDMNVKKMDISIPYDGTYDGIVSVIESVGTSPRRIIVDSLSVDRKSDAELSGNMSLKVYSLEGLADVDPNVIYVDVADGTGQGSMFGAFSGYKDDTSTSTTGVESTEIDESDYMKVYTLHDFEKRSYSFVPSTSMIKGDVSPSTTAKSGKYSLRFEYNMLAMEEENKAFIDLSKADINLNYPPESIGMWINSYAYSPGILGLRFRTQGGEDIDVTASEGISWLGWSNVEAAAPADLNLYPLSLTHIYYELPYNRDDVGVFLIDKLEARYPVSEDTAANSKPANYFYVVEIGDTVTSISKKIYGTVAYKNEIMKNNSLTSGDLLTVGKVLVLVRR